MADDLGALVQQARTGNHEAFVDLVASTMRDLRVFAATYASSQAMAEAVLTATVGAIRRRLGECPADATTHNWMRRITAEVLAERLDEADRAAVAGQDTLNHVVIQAGREALQGNPAVDNSAGSRLGAGYGQLSDEAQKLIAMRYGEGQTAGGIAQELGLGEDVVTHGLCAARAQLDWTGAAGALDGSDRLFPALVEDWLAGAIVPDSRALLVAAVMQDMERATRFERQVRLHLMLSAWYGPATRGDAQALVASLGSPTPSTPSATHESGRMAMAPQAASRSSGQHPRPSTATLRRGTGTSSRPSSGQRRVVAGHRARSSGQHQAALPDLADDDDAPKSNRTPLIIAGTLVLIGLIGLLAVWMRSGTVERPVVPAQPSTAAAPAATSATLALVHRAEGKAIVTQKGKQVPAETGVGLDTGDGMETSGDTAQLGVLALDQVRLTLRGDAAVGGLAFKDQALQVMLTRGRLLVEAMSGGQVRSVAVITAYGRAEFPPGTGGVVHVLDGATRLEGLKGSARLLRAAGGAGVEVAAGRSATVREGGDPAVDQPARFIRGINVGGETVTVDGKRWLSWKQALGAGLTVSPGSQTAPPAPVNSRGLDFDSKIMLDSGLIAPVGALKLAQVLPNGEFDVSLWIAGEGTVTGQGIELTLNGQGTPLGQSSFRGDGWRMLGPYRVAVKNGRLELAIAGLRNVRLAGLALWATGRLEGSPPPTVVITAPEPGRRSVRRDLVMTADALSLGGEIAKVEFLVGEQVIGQAVRPPWTVVWDKPANGSHRITARATDGAGVSATSAPLEVEIDVGDGSGAVAVEQWSGIGGGSIDDLLRASTFPGSPAQRYERESFTNRFSGNDQGSRWRAWIVPPVDGEYVFGVSSDDNAQLWLGGSEDPASRVRIAGVPDHTNYNEWEKYPEQTSRPITLVAKRRYWIEVLHKQGGGDAHLAVRWRLPDGSWETPIPGSRLYPVPFETPTVVPNPALAAAPVPTPAPTPTPVPTPAPTTPTPAPASNAAPQLKGVYERPAELANLTQEGSEDWIHYGLSDAKSVNRKAGDLPLLGVLKTIDNAEIKRYDNNPVKFSWGDGAPSASANGANFGVFTEANGKGFQFTAPADQTLRSLRIWLGAFECRGQLVATLSDASAPPYRDDSVQIQKGSVFGVYTLTYRAKSPGQMLTVNFTPAVATGNINFQAVALALLEPRVVGFVKGVNFFGEPTTVDGNKWLGLKQAEADGLVVRNARKAGAVVEPKPPVDAGTKAMLTSGAAAKAGEELAITQRLVNGRYDVTIYVMETVVANARLFDLQIEDETLPNVGALPMNTWAKYGPVTVTVRDGVLDLSTKTRKGSPIIMGFSISTSAR